jgi:type II secretory pathway pseudopilin PulG
MEMLVSIVLLSILSGIIAVVIGSTFATMGAVAERKKAVMDGAHAINMFQRDLLTMQDSTQLLVADDQQIRFTNNFGRTIEYTVDGDSLKRQIVGVGSAEIVVAPIDNATTSFHYYSQSNSEFTSYPLSSTNRGNTRLFELQLEVDDGGSGVYFLARVFPENLKITERGL